MNLPAKMDVEKDKLRQMHCEFNPLSRCDGSVMYSQGIAVFSTLVHGQNRLTWSCQFQVLQVS